MLHAPPYPDIACSHLAQRLVETDEDAVHQTLRQRGILAEARQRQPGVHGEQIETAVQRIGHAEPCKKDRFPRPRHHASINALGGAPARLAPGDDVQHDTSLQPAALASGARQG